LGPVVLLDIDEATFLERVGSGENRGLAIGPGKTMHDLYNERLPLYRKVADVTVRTDALTPEASVDHILEHIRIS